MLITFPEDRYTVSVKPFEQVCRQYAKRTVQSALEHERCQLLMLKAWRFPARMHSRTNLPLSRGLWRCL